jgi:signal transduction histidine kinase
VHSVLTNVLSNAEKFTPEDARIAVAVKPVRGGRWSVAVSDNGRGPEGGKAAFEMFKTTSDPRTAGLGIGLTLARQIVRAHGGEIRLRRAPRGGAVVTFDLPAAPGRG